MKVTQSGPILCDPMDYTVHEILQARVLEWVAFPFSRGSSRPGDLPDPGIKPMSPTLAGRFFTTEPPGKLFDKRC